ncbi:hypothetical protein [Halalkalibacter akibai]|uniref:Uncharacterized protein n=1 Tax=Halalkalibacter akibai (strain ATCC 43226 / DSM 21942 / CIP 109018 / JCM 9157 / 1139) TaxID=1236973 RepID=W4QSD4_HALA3|nr:hypothetical protein [Halalkalibacter akibai]GAE34249.1 hypothetical protein JCM9157_1295 [Halalkalibacter akibai JCM 9157]
MKSKPHLASGTVRQKVVADTLKSSIGKKVFILIQPYPFVIIGNLLEIKSDFLLVEIEPDHLSELKQGLIHVKITDIEAFYIEEASFSSNDKS